MFGVVTTGKREAFGARLRRLREGQGIGLRDMSRRLDISPAYLSRVETGGHDPPAEPVVRAVAALLGVEADDLLVHAGRVPIDVEAWLLADWRRVTEVRAMMTRKGTAR